MVDSIWHYFVTLGFGIGLFINACLFIPQAMKLVKVKHSKDLALTTFLGFNIIQLFTAMHGYLVKDYILFGGSLLSFITCACVTFLILYYHKQTQSD